MDSVSHRHFPSYRVQHSSRFVGYGNQTTGLPRPQGVLRAGEGFTLAMTSLLLVEDDRSLASALSDLLKEEQFSVDHCVDGEDALDYLAGHPYDVAIVDVMLPGMNGFTLLSKMRKDGHTLPVLMLTARDDVSDRVRGLDAGADDYLTKPFAGIELLARVRALLRRLQGEFADSDILVAGSVRFHLRSRELTVDQESETLAPKEAALLELFMRHPGQILTKEQIMRRLWGYDGDVLENTLEAYVSRLRKRLGRQECPTIQTVRSLGYRWQTGG